MNLVKIGNRIVNLDRMNYSIVDTGKLLVRFSGSDPNDTQTFEKGEAKALWALLEKSAQAIA